MLINLSFEDVLPDFLIVSLISLFPSHDSPPAAADGSTKGAASFTANDFDASSGNEKRPA